MKARLSVCFYVTWQLQETSATKNIKKSNSWLIMHHDHRQSVSIAGDGIEIGRLQIHLDEKRTSHIKSQILEARLDDSASLADTDSKLYQLVYNSRLT